VVGTLAAPVIDRDRTARVTRVRAFSLVDVLVTLAVIAVLIGLLLPTLSGVRETTRQVVCRSNVRQFGYGIVLFADDHQDKVPKSDYANSQPHLTILVRRQNPTPWDGLGFLFSQDYLPAPGVFYCPSHTGTHPFSTYADRWTRTALELPYDQFDIITNYQYRGDVPGMDRLSLITRPRAALVADALRTSADFNHEIGTNLLRADLSVNWYADPGGRISGQLPGEDADPSAASKVHQAWEQLDLPSGGS
jgi:competence protein ComGC